MNYGKIYRELMSGLYTECELERIQKARISISGAGGAIGSYLLDLLLRKGFEHFVLSDPDIYDVRNISRQLFANCSTVGKRKLEAAVEHIAGVNPNAECKTIESVNVNTVRQFVAEADVVSHQAEGFSSWILTLHACAQYRIPFVNASRKGNSRTTVATRVYDFRSDVKEFDLTSIDFASFGLPKKISKDVIKMFKSEELNLGLLNKADRIHNEFKKNERFRDLKYIYPEVGSIEERYPEDYHKRYTEPEICLLAAALAGRAIIDIVIGRITKIKELDVFSRK